MDEITICSPAADAQNARSQRIILLAAVAQNNVIGLDGQLPWRIASDLRFFRCVTQGFPMVMGRKTRDSFGAKPLPQRPHIVLTRNTGYAAAGTQVAHTLQQALAMAAQHNAQQTFIIGGAQIYSLAMEYITHAIITRVPQSPAGDAVFPSLAPHIAITEFTPQQLDTLNMLQLLRL